MRKKMREKMVDSSEKAIEICFCLIHNLIILQHQTILIRHAFLEGFRPQDQLSV